MAEPNGKALPGHSSTCGTSTPPPASTQCEKFLGGERERGVLSWPKKLAPVHRKIKILATRLHSKLEAPPSSRGAELCLAGLHVPWLIYDL